MLLAIAMLVLVMPFNQEPPVSEQVKKAVQSLEQEIKELKAATNLLKEREAKRNAASVKRAERRVVQRRQALEAAVERERAIKAQVTVKTEQAIIDMQESVPLASIDEKKIDLSLVSEANRQLFMSLLHDRAALREKIRRQNNRRACRWFRIGCIGRK